MKKVNATYASTYRISPVTTQPPYSDRSSCSLVFPGFICPFGSSLAAWAGCSTVARPAISEKRLSLTSQGKVRYELKTPYRDGPTHVIFDPLDLIAKLAALVPKPGVNLRRFHGVFDPNSNHRALLTPAKRGKGSQQVADEQGEKTPAQRHVAMTWAQRLKRVFGIDVETCRVCGGTARVIACIEDPVVIKTILLYIDAQVPKPGEFVLPDSRAPPQASLFC